MKRKESRPLKQHSLNLFEGQFDWLQARFPRAGAAKIIRTLIDQFIEKQETEAATAVPEPAIEVTLEDLA